MSHFIPVDLPQQSYGIVIGAGSLDYLGQWLSQDPAMAETKLPLLPKNLGSKALLVSNPVIFRQYGDRVLTALSKAGFDVQPCILPAGERYKTLSSVQKIYDAALAHRLERSSTLVALGGGVVGDMTGFAAATWLRGINLVQVPTSLLAMVDAAIGGKTGVNHPQGKNLIGAFHQPRLVLIDPNVLETLPPREFRAGMAEVIKYGVIWSLPLFELLEACDRLHLLKVLQLPMDSAIATSPDVTTILEQILIYSCQAKAHVVSKDEKEAGLRAILNYGHTVGHAVESLTGYRTVNHGEAVGIGMVVAGQIAAYQGLWSQADCDRQNHLIQKAGLPTTLPAGLDLDDILEALKTDKKVKAGRVRFVLPTQIGAATVTDQVSPETLQQVLLECCASHDASKLLKPE